MWHNVINTDCPRNLSLGKRLMLKTDNSTSDATDRHPKFNLLWDGDTDQPQALFGVNQTTTVPKPTASVQPFTMLLQGDCLHRLREVKPESVHLLITDPPYFLDGLDDAWKKGVVEPRPTGAVEGLPPGMKFDPRQGKVLQRFIAKVGRAVMPTLKPGAFALWFSQPRLVHRMGVGLEDAGFEIRDVYAWHYTQRAQGKAFSMDHFVNQMKVPPETKAEMLAQLGGRKTAQLRPQFESIILAQRPGSGTLVRNWLEHETGLADLNVLLNGLTPSTVMDVEKPIKAQYNAHLSVKPVRLLRHLISIFSKPGQTVLDPFLGSGTTAVAAQQLDRSCIGIEINSEYIQTANRRLREETL